eukprot:scaffold60552_cov28-Tisochrysis_lutea.AAC.3
MPVDFSPLAANTSWPGRKTLHARETSCKAQGAHPAAVHMVVYVYRINNNVACSPRSVAAVAFTH